jgi:hypothetical protein
MTELIVKSSSRAKHKVARAILREALDRQQKMLQAALLKTTESLSSFEHRYDLDSARFFSQYQNGKTDDRDDYVDWAGEYQILLSIQNQLDCLEEIILCK